MSEWIDAFSDDDDIFELVGEKSMPVSKAVTSSKRKRKLVGGQVSRSSNTEELWLNKYKPSSCAQVAGNKAKISQLKQWVAELLDKGGRNEGRILLITGPSGSGKTAVVEAIAAELCCSVVQWSSEHSEYVPLEERGDNSIDYQSQGALFDNFISRATKYSSLPLVGDSIDIQTGRQIVLIEDIPSVYMKNAAEWHNKLRLCNKSTRHLVVVVFNTSGAVTERVLFPDSLQQELNIKHVAFNPVPKTDIKRLLITIADNEESLNIPKDFITSLSESCDGDIRTAVNTLQFTFSAPQSAITSVSKTSSRRKGSSSFTKRKGRESKTPNTQDDVDESRRDHQKDPSLIIFRALGKVLYCKREVTQSEVETKLPAHLRHHVRPDMAFNPEQVFEQSKVSADYYTLCLHQNFPHFITNLENVRSTTDYLSHSDCLSNQFESRNVTGKASVGVSIAARGLMHSNTSLSKKHGWAPLRKPYWFSARKRLSEHQTNLKWQNNTIFSSSAVSTDLIPALHMMKSVCPLTSVIPAIISSPYYTQSAYDRLDDKFGRDDVQLDVTPGEQTTSDIAENISNEEAGETGHDDPSEFLIEAVD